MNSGSRDFIISNKNLKLTDIFFHKIMVILSIETWYW